VIKSKKINLIEILVADTENKVAISKSGTERKKKEEILK